MAPMLGRGVLGVGGLAAVALLSSCRRLGPAAAVGGPPPAARRPPGAFRSPASGYPPSAAGKDRPGAADSRQPTGDSHDGRPPAFATDGALAQRLKAVVEDAVSRGVTRRVGVAVYDLATGQGTGIHVSEVFRPASVIKLGVLVAAYQARPHMVGAQFNRLRPDLERMIKIGRASCRERVEISGVADGEQDRA